MIDFVQYSVLGENIPSRIRAELRAICQPVGPARMRWICGPLTEAVRRSWAHWAYAGNLRLSHNGGNHEVKGRLRDYQLRLGSQLAKKTV